jgi:hypothetical protein
MQGEVMNASWKNRLSLAGVAAVVVLGVVVMARWQPAQAEQRAARAAQQAPIRYSVIETEGHNLIVTDNSNNTLYFYTIDKDKEVGAELKLRGTIDLNQVGQPVIKPVPPKTGK